MLLFRNLFLKKEVYTDNLTYRIENIDQGFLCGIVSSERVPFSINSTICTIGCTDPAALNYDNTANTPCFGDNSCCNYPPVNDDCENAIELETGEIYFWNTKEANISEFSCDGLTHDVWYYYTSECDEMLAFSGHGSDGFQFCVYLDECPIDNAADAMHTPEFNQHLLNQYANRIDRSETYYFRVGTDSGLNDLGGGELKLDVRGCLGCTQDNAWNTENGATLDDGSCLYPGECAGDLNGDNMVTAADLTIFLDSFGNICPVSIDLFNGQ